MDKVDKLIAEKTEYFEQIYRDIETEILVEIASMMNRNGIIPSGVYKLEKLQEDIGLDREVLLKLAEITGKPLDEVIETLEEIGFKSVDFPMYRKAYDLNLLNKSIDELSIQPYIDNVATDTMKLVKSVETTAKENAFKAYRRTIDKSVAEVHMGVKTPTQAMIDAVKDLNEEGITSATYKRKGKDGKDIEVKQQLETVMLRTIRTEMVKTSNTVANEVGKELGVDTWYITQHIGARNKVYKHEYENHAKWQGTIVTTKELETIAGYGEITGLGGIHCRHRHYAYIEGVSVKPPPQIDEFKNDEVYKLEQKQRRLENAIRLAKREVMMLKELDVSMPEVEAEIEKSKRKVKDRQKVIEEFIKDNEKVLKRDFSREKVNGYK